MLRILILAILASALLADDAGAQTKIGVAAAVNQQLTGTPPAAAGRTVEVGNDVFHRERLVTDARGQAQMLFVDGSAFTVGPDSDLVLDEFVFDPATGTGKLAATAAKGVVRFVGGKLSKNQPVTITTPTATIGIRGGIGIVSVDGLTGATNATFLFGIEMTVTSSTGAIERIARPGFTTSVQGRGAAPTAATRAAPDQIKQSLEQLNGRADANGGAQQQPTGAQVAERMPGQGAGQPPPPGQNQAGIRRQGQTQNQTQNQQAGRDATQQTQRNAVTNAALPAGAIVTYRVDPDASLGTSMPSVRSGASGGTTSPVTSNFIGVSSGPTGTVKSVQVSVGIDGSGSGQHSVVVVTTGEGANNTGMLTTTRGSSRANADRETTAIGSTSTIQGTGTVNSFAAGRMPEGFTQSGSGTDAGLSGGSASYTYRQTGTRITSTPSVGTRETQTLNGYAAAFADSVRSDGRIDPSTPLLAGTGSPGGPGSISINTDAATGRLAATFNMTTEAGANGPNVTLNFGGDAAHGTYVDRNRFAAVESSTGVTITDTAGTRNATSSQLYLVSSGLSGASLPGGVQACACEFVQWGWWGGAIAATNASNVAQTHALHMGTWVAGPVVSQSEMPTTGSASYAGHAVGTVINGSARYLAAGSYSANFNFASRSGSMSISNFDGLNMSGAISSTNGRDYASTLDITGKADLAGRAQGSFFSGGGDPTRETGGQFTVSGKPGTNANYAAIGVFVGKKQ